jgi:hypothetical protein
VPQTGDHGQPFLSWRRSVPDPSAAAAIPPTGGPAPHPPARIRNRLPRHLPRRVRSCRAQCLGRNRFPPRTTVGAHVGAAGRGHGWFAAAAVPAALRPQAPTP